MALSDYQRGEIEPPLMRHTNESHDDFNRLNQETAKRENKKADRQSELER